MPSSSAWLHQRREASIRQAGRPVVGDAANDLAVAAADQFVGHGFRDAGASGDREQMRLALGPGDIDQVGVSQPRRLLQHRARHRDVVVLGEPPHRLDRRVADRRQAMGQFGPRLGLDLLDQAREDAVEQLDMLVVEVIGAVEKQRCDPLQGARATLGRAVLEHFLQFGNQRGGGGHSLDPAGSTGESNKARRREPANMRGILKEGLANSYPDGPGWPCADWPNRYISRCPLRTSHNGRMKSDRFLRVGSPRDPLFFVTARRGSWPRERSKSGGTYRRDLGLND